MKVYIDMIAFQLQRVGGISIVWLELLKRMNRDKCNIEYVLQKKPYNNIFYLEIEKGMQLFSEEPLRSIKLLRYLPIFKRVNQISIFHSTYYRISLDKRAINVTTVHDFTYEYYEKWIRKFVHCLQKRIAIKNSKGIICISENTKKDLLKFYPKIDESKICVIHNGVSEEYKKLDEKNYVDELGKYNNCKFLLYVGERSKYKKFDFAVRIAKQIGMPMVIIGGKQLNQYENELLDDMLANNYIHLFGLTNEKLNSIYNSAFALIYPSRYEGFGIPILEAKRAGCPVIAYNCSSIPEVMGRSDFLMNNYNVESWVFQLKKLYDLDYKNQIIISGIEYSSNFSWERTYKKTCEYYDYLYSKYGR